MCSTTCALPQGGEHVPGRASFENWPTQLCQRCCIAEILHALSRCTPAESRQAAVLRTVELRVDFSPTPAASQTSARRTKKKSAISTCTKALVGGMQQVRIQAIPLYVLQDVCQVAAPAAKSVGSPNASPTLCTLSTVCFRLLMKPSLDSTFACNMSLV